MSVHELAQLNIGIFRAPIDSPEMAEFVANLDRINALAEASPGFVWRLQTEEGNATAIRPFPDRDNVAINLSVWSDVHALNCFVFRSAHVEVMRRRGEWFERMGEAYMVLWWVRAGHRPSVGEAIAKLALLRANGPTRDAFTFRQAFASPDAATQAGFENFGDTCPAT
ncbi:MAG: DUF3291 domain-containing protein [Rudaea sp.]